MTQEDSTRLVFYYCHHQPADHRHYYRAWLQAARARGLSIVLVSTYSCNDGDYQSTENELYFRTSALLSFLRVPLFILRQALRTRCVVVVRKRNPVIIAILSLITRNVRLVVEMEGDRESELSFVAESNKYNGILRALHSVYRWYRCRVEDGITFRAASRIVVVSRTLKRIIASKYGIASSKIVVFPTGVDTQRTFFDPELRRRTRERLECNGQVFVYVGSTLKWQMLDRFERIFEHVRSISEAQAILIIRTRDDDLIARFRRIDASTIIKINLPHEALNDYLNAADIGIVFRENNLLNRAAMPGKCGDYLATGLRVAMSPHVGDYAEDVQEVGAGVLIDDDEDDKVAAQRIVTYAGRPHNRERVARWAHRRYGIHNHIEEYVHCIRNAFHESAS